MKTLRTVAAAVLLGFCGAAPAPAGPVLVELFTSQGCSSCPPADEFLTELAARDDVVALGLHVDYWDYLGWRDELAVPEFTRRQAAYNERLKSRYKLVTPQMVINGRIQFAGVHKTKVGEAVSRFGRETEAFRFEAGRIGNRLSVLVAPMNSAAAAASRFDIFLAKIDPAVRVRIDHGENAGRTMTYSNVVVSWERLGIWNGRQPASFTRQVEPTVPLVLLLQGAGYGPVFAVQKIR